LLKLKIYINPSTFLSSQEIKPLLSHADHQSAFFQIPAFKCVTAITGWKRIQAHRKIGIFIICVFFSVLGGGWAVFGCDAPDPSNPEYYAACSELDDASYALEASYPEDDNTWSVMISNTGDVDIEVDLRVSAICGFVQN
jgi:hypothetical protein